MSILLIADLLSISVSGAETLLRSCPTAVSLRGFFRRLSEGELDHPVISKTARLRLNAMLKLQTQMAEQCLEVGQKA